MGAEPKKPVGTTETTETVVGRDYVTVTSRIPTHEHYLRKVAPRICQEMDKELHDDLRRFMSAISYRIDRSLIHDEQLCEGGDMVMTFRPVDGMDEPFLSTLPPEAEGWLSDEGRDAHPLLAKLCKEWGRHQDDLRDAYGAVTEAEHHLAVLDEEVSRLPKATEPIDADKIVTLQARRDAARDEVAEAHKAYIRAKDAALQSVMIVAMTHMDKAMRHVRSDEGYEEWLAENATE